MAISDSAPLEAALIRRIALGDIDAFEALYDTHSTSLYSLAFRILNDSGDAEEVMQDVFLKIWKKAHSYNESKGKPLSWAVQMTRNQAIDRLRGRKRENHTFGFSSEEVIESGAAIQPVESMPADEAEGNRLSGQKAP